MAIQSLRRILLTGDTEGGVWTFTLELADGLLRSGAEVCLATFGRRATGSQSQSACGIEGLHWLHHSSKLEWMHEPWTDIQRAGYWLKEIARQWCPDLVHLNTLCHGTLPWTVPVAITHHSCVISWWRAVKRSPLPEDWRHYQQEVERSLKSATVITAASHSALTDVGRDYNIDVIEARAIPNGRRSGAFHVGKKEGFILSAGRLWDEAKNVRALAELARRLPWPVYLAGDSHDPSGRAATFDSCRFLGNLNTSELSSCYARAAIYAAPARYEPFGLSILEAALSGCALVLGDIASLREIWQDAAEFVPPDDTASLEASLKKLIADPEFRARMSRRAFHRAHEFTPSRMLDGYVSLYESALSKYERDIRRHACAS
jgi:glycosyltransferase involved in cell wall biosynthesis